MNKLIKLEHSPFGLDSYHINYIIDDIEYQGILIRKDKLDQPMELNNDITQ